MSIAVVWLKRDLRLADHAPLMAAAASKKPLLLVYCFEPMLMDDPHYRARHWQFVADSLQDIQSRIPKGALFVANQDAQTVLGMLYEKYGVSDIYSYQEVGLQNTFDRDKLIAACCKNAGIRWHETPYGAVIRGLKNRKTWDEYWQKVMRAEQAHVDLSLLNWFTEHDLDSELENVIDALPKEEGTFQKGGEQQAQQVLASFFEQRGQAYFYSISSPLESQIHCSRLSAYLAWGNLSLKQVYQSVLDNWHKAGWRRSLIAFASRLHWHCHFVQKFESASDIQFENLNSGYNALPRVTGQLAEQRLTAWKQGNTGVPMVDACMRCLIATGYINFRMRAMLVSFLCHHLELDWRSGVEHLAGLFLDFEPGIHYSQFQMQAGVTGFNTIRIYSPVKQGLEKDPDGEFVKTWVPELADVPAPLVHEPWQLSAMEMMMYQITLGEDYPEPIVNLEQSYKAAQDQMWRWRKRPEVQAQIGALLARHVRTNSK